VIEDLDKRSRANDEDALARAKAKHPHHEGELDCLDCGAEVGIYRALMHQRKYCITCDLRRGRQSYARESAQS
jgi:hypothetical protein